MQSTQRAGYVETRLRGYPSACNEVKERLRFKSTLRTYFLYTNDGRLTHVFINK